MNYVHNSINKVAWSCMWDAVMGLLLLLMPRNLALWCSGHSPSFVTESRLVTSEPFSPFSVID